jgi:hypothetical protein
MTRRTWTLLAAAGAALAQGKAQRSGATEIGFSGAERETIWGYFEINPGQVSAAARALPPGLAKKAQRGQALPSGWQKKIAAMPSALDLRLRPLPDGYRRVMVDRWALILAKATNVVMDIMDVMGR